MIRIHVADHAEADAVWRMLCSVPDHLFQPVDLHLDGYGPLYQAVRTPDGDQSAAPPSAQLGHTTQP